MPISTKLTRALGIRHPLVQGGMHYVGYAELVAAVGNAGAIGCITALTQPSPELLQREIRQVQQLHTILTSQPIIQHFPLLQCLLPGRKCKELSKAPFGVNLTLLPTLQPPDYPAYADVVEHEMRSGQLRLIETAGHFKGRSSVTPDTAAVIQAGRRNTYLTLT